MSVTRRKNIWKIEKCTKQLVLIVERNAKFLSNQQKANQSNVKIALEKISHSEALAETTAETETSAAIIVNSETTDQEKCTKQLVLIVERNAKSHSNRVETSQLDVENVFRQLETRSSSFKHNFYFFINYFYGKRKTFRILFNNSTNSPGNKNRSDDRNTNNNKQTIRTRNRTQSSTNSSTNSPNQHPSFSLSHFISTPNSFNLLTCACTIASTFPTILTNSFLSATKVFKAPL